MTTCRTIFRFFSSSLIRSTTCCRLAALGCSWWRHYENLLLQPIRRAMQKRINWSNAIHKPFIGFWQPRKAGLNKHAGKSYIHKITGNDLVILWGYRFCGFSDLGGSVRASGGDSDSCGRSEPYIRWDGCAIWRHLKNTTAWSVHGGDTA